MNCPAMSSTVAPMLQSTTSRFAQVKRPSLYRGFILPQCAAVMLPAQLEQTKGEIEAKKRFISSLPPCEDRSREGLIKAMHIKALAEKEEEYEIHTEMERAAKVVREHEEQHPPYTEECPVCLDDVRIVDHDAMLYCSCCGKGCCMDCHKSAKRDGIDGMRVCPLCRSKYLDQDHCRLGRQWAEKGLPWAQAIVGNTYFTGDRNNGYEVNKTKAIKWLELAAEQGYPPALMDLAGMYKDEGDDVTASHKYMTLLKRAANVGCTHAQLHLVTIYWKGNEPDDESALHYMTLALVQGKSVAASFQLGSFFRGTSPYRSKYYLEEAAAKGFDGAYYPLALTLLVLHNFQYNNGMHDVPGHCYVPRALFWARKAVSDKYDNKDEKVQDYNQVTKALSKEDANDLIGSLEFMFKQCCASCGKDAGCFPEQLKRCARCKAVWYCGRECQVKHWKDGHKVDCVK